MFTRTVSPVGHDSITQMWAWLLRDIPLFIFIVLTAAQGLPNLLLGISPARGLAAVESGAGSLLRQILVLATIAALSLWHIANRLSVQWLARQIWPFVPITLWILASVAWSSYPDITIRRSIHFVLELVAMAFFAAAYHDQFKLLRVIYLSFGAVVLLDIAMLADAQSFSSIGYVGIHSHKNDTGAFCFIAIPVFFAAVLDRRIFPVRLISTTLLALAITLLILSRSKTAITLLPICFVLALGFVQLGRVQTKLMSVIMIIGSLFAFIVTALAFNFGISNLLNYVFSDATLTGRDRIWDFVLYRISQEPIIGHGYGAIWYVGEGTVRLARAFGLTWEGVASAHNGYLDVTAQLGMVGLVLTLVLLIGTIYRLWRLTANMQADRVIYVGVFAAFGMVLYNITETTLFVPGSNSWMFFILLSQAAYSCSIVLFRRSDSSVFLRRRGVYG